jgi:RNA recognition motif-containing protein
MSDLLLMNIPYNASNREIREWIESRGVETKSIRIVRDLVTGASPAFGHVELQGSIELKEAISILHGKRMRNQTVLAKEGPAYC